MNWSSVNYKDGLACSPNGRVVGACPMIPGIGDILNGNVRGRTLVRVGG